MAFPAILPRPFELVIFVPGRQFFSVGQKMNDLFQLIHIFAAPGKELHIPFKPGVAPDGPHS